MNLAFKLFPSDKLIFASGIPFIKLEDKIRNFLLGIIHL